MDDDLTFSYYVRTNINTSCCCCCCCFAFCARCVFCFWYIYMCTHNMDSFPLVHSSFRFGAFLNLLSFHNCERVSFTQTSFKRIASYLNSRKLFLFFALKFEWKKCKYFISILNATHFVVISFLSFLFFWFTHYIMFTILWHCTVGVAYIAVFAISPKEIYSIFKSHLESHNNNIIFPSFQSLVTHFVAL